MTEREAWESLAMVVARRPSWFREGLCMEMNCRIRDWQSAIPKLLPVYQMLDRMKVHAGMARDGAYLYSPYEPEGGRASAHARVIFCLLMALECEDEARGR